MSVLAVPLGSGPRAQMTVFLLEAAPVEAEKKRLFVQALFNDSGGLLNFLIMYFPGCQPALSYKELEKSFLT